MIYTSIRGMNVINVNIKLTASQKNIRKIIIYLTTKTQYRINETDFDCSAMQKQL